MIELRPRLNCHFDGAVAKDARASDLNDESKSSDLSTGICKQRDMKARERGEVGIEGGRGTWGGREEREWPTGKSPHCGFRAISRKMMTWASSSVEEASSLERAGP